MRFSMLALKRFLILVAALLAAAYCASVYGPQFLGSAPAHAQIANDVPGYVGVPGPEPTLPEPPSGLKAVAVLPTEVILVWEPPRDMARVAGYKIYRNGSFYKTSIEPQASDLEIAPATRYCYAVSTYDIKQMESARTGEVCVTAPMK
jgi:hypothetical protein